MRLTSPYSISGQLITALLAGVMIIGPAGCNGYQVSLNGGSTTTTSLFGFLINTDTTSDLLGTLRLTDGNAVFVYGTRDSDGNVADVQAAVLRNAKGDEAGVNLDGGLLSKAKGFDGSTLAITYDQRDTSRVRGHANIFFAGADPDKQNQVLQFDLDLQKALADLAAQVKQYTGIDISTAPPPKDPGKWIRPDMLSTAKGDNASPIIIFAPFFLFAFATAGYFMVQFMGQFIELMVKTYVVIAEAIIIAAFSPFILLGEILRGSVGQPISTIDIGWNLGQNGVTIPRRPYL
jgi:hypothetical protein